MNVARVRALTSWRRITPRHNAMIWSVFRAMYKPGRPVVAHEVGCRCTEPPNIWRWPW